MEEACRTDDAISTTTGSGGVSTLDPGVDRAQRQGRFTQQGADRVEVRRRATLFLYFDFVL